LNGSCKPATANFEKALKIDPGYQEAELGLKKTRDALCGPSSPQHAKSAQPVIKQKTFQGGGAALDESQW
jgi:hypothetical protein